MGRHGTIAGRKAAQDSKRSAMFTKYARQIIVAAKAGGDPEYNATLRVAIAKAKGIGMPNDNIKRTIDKALGAGNTDNYEAVTYEGYGPCGVADIVEALTDNTNRTTASVRSTFDKHGGNLGTPGCVSYMFNRKGVLVIEKTDELDEDELMMMALDAGAEDMVVNEDSFETEPAAFNDVHGALSEAGLEFVEAEVEYVPSMEAAPKDEKELKRLKKMIDILEENDDVQKVHHNCSVDLEEIE